MDTVADGARQLTVVPHRRKALVFIGAPVLFWPTEPRAPQPATYSASWYRALQTLAAANVVLYYIDPRGLVHDGPDITSTSPTSIRAADETFDHAITFAHETGGTALVRSNLFDRALDLIASQKPELALTTTSCERGKAKLKCAARAGLRAERQTINPVTFSLHPLHRLTWRPREQPIAPGGGSNVPPPPISLHELGRFLVFLEDVSEVSGGNPHRTNALTPEVARHQEVPKRATFAFDSRRLHHP